jgi:hypothetical protein
MNPGHDNSLPIRYGMRAMTRETLPDPDGKADIPRVRRTSIAL